MATQMRVMAPEQQHAELLVMPFVPSRAVGTVSGGSWCPSLVRTCALVRGLRV
jgi:hypothetical protein